VSISTTVQSSGGYLGYPDRKFKYSPIQGLEHEVEWQLQSLGGFAYRQAWPLFCMSCHVAFWHTGSAICSFVILGTKLALEYGFLRPLWVFSTLFNPRSVGFKTTTRRWETRWVKYFIHLNPYCSVPFANSLCIARDRWLLRTMLYVLSI